MIRAVTTFIALLIALLASGCGEKKDKDDISGYYTQTVESGIYAHEQELCDPPFLKEENSGFCYEPMEATNTLGLLKTDDGKMQFATQLAFFNWETCSVKGVANKDGDAWVYKGDETDNCEITIRKNNDKIILTTDKAANCSSHCDGRGAIDGTTFDIPSREKEKITPRQLECIIPESAENGEKC